MVAALVVLLAALDLLRFAHGYQPMAPADLVPPPTTPALAFLQRHDGAGRMAALQYAVFGDMATVYGLHDVRGYDQPQPSVRFFRMWQTVEPAQAPGTAYLVTELSDRHLRMLGMLGMRHVVLPPEARLGEGAVLRVAYRGEDAVVLRNPYALPRASVAPAVTVAGTDDEEVGVVTEPRFDAREGAVVRADEVGDAAPAGVEGGTARVVRDENARVELRASLPRPGLVVLGDAWAPGWSVSVDGKPARALQTDVVLRGVQVPAGEHEVVWSYRVPGLRAGALLSLLGLLGFAAWGGWIVRRRRAGGAPA